MLLETKRGSNSLRLRLLDRLLPIKTDNYQRQRFPQEKSDLILQNLDLASIGSVLDVGCNEGRITQYFAERGKFAVGIDNAPYYMRNMLREFYAPHTPIFGTVHLTPTNVSTLPAFDLVLVLSVHHWWVKEFGDAVAQDMVRALLERSRRCMIIEFSAIREKYGYATPRFVDNDDTSVIDYATRWLQEMDKAARIQYIGKSKETAGRERFRHIFRLEQ